MSNTETLKALASMTDAGLFEQLATAVLREANAYYRSLIHTGTNTSGQTIKGIVDGVMFIPEAEPPHMVTVHHTIGDKSNLNKKWLYDPSTVKSKSTTVKKTPPGDILKTIQLYNDERKRTPNLIGTLVLTVTSDPAIDVIRNAEAKAREGGITIDFWSASRIAHFLDTNPNGQYLRKRYLDIIQERLSKNLLQELSLQSIKKFTLSDDETAWIDRSMDIDLNDLGKTGVIIISAESGKGKSVACYRYLSKHIENDGYGIVLPHEILAESYSVEQAIDKVLKTLHHPLEDNSGIEALKFSSPDKPIVLIVEDINKYGNAAPILLEKIAKWHKEIATNPIYAWQILCPTWPQHITVLNVEIQKTISDRIINCPAFSIHEGIHAVTRRYKIGSKKITNLEAENISTALGNDPLLIALHNVDEQPSPSLVIKNFINNKLTQLSRTNDAFTASEYLSSIQQLILNMYNNRIMQPTWHDITQFNLSSDQLRMLRSIASQGHVFRLIGDIDTEHIVFRHDRVRDWLAAQTISQHLVAADLDKNLISEPYHARVIGLSLNMQNITPEIVQEIKSINPLALFYALQEFLVAKTKIQNSIISSIQEWLEEQNTHQKSHEYLRFECLNLLSTIDSPHVLKILEGFKDKTWSLMRAGFRNGDLGKGIELCQRSGPGINDSMHEQLVSHVITKNQPQMLEALKTLLRRNDLSVHHRSGILRLCGYLADNNLYSNIQYAWENESPEDRLSILDDYFWACAHCCGDSPEKLLDPIIEVWALLSDDEKEKGMPSDRDSFASHEIRFAFQKYIPHDAIEYLISQTKRDELEWPITYLLHNIDHPSAVKYIVHYLAQNAKELEGTESFFHFRNVVIEAWKRQQNNKSMSKESRSLLFEYWSNQKEEKHLRLESFYLWSATQDKKDIEILRAFQEDTILHDAILKRRIQRIDVEAIPSIIKKISTSDNSAYWWQFTRNIWSDELTVALDEELQKRSSQIIEKWVDYSYPSDWIIHELITKLPSHTAEEILLKHWNHLQYTPRFIQTALYIATEKLAVLASQSINECPDPKSLFKFLPSTYGIHTIGRPGITKIRQLEVLLPYISFLDEAMFITCVEVCYKHGWFDFGKKHFEQSLQADKSISFENFNVAKIQSMLNELIKYNHISFISYRIDEFLKMGISTQDILTVVLDWVKSQNKIDLKIIDLASQVILNIGTRNDYSKLLDICSNVKNEYLEHLDNIYYLLQTRQLH